MDNRVWNFFELGNKRYAVDFVVHRSPGREREEEEKQTKRKKKKKQKKTLLLNNLLLFSHRPIVLKVFQYNIDNT